MLAKILHMQLHRAVGNSLLHMKSTFTILDILFLD